MQKLEINHTPEYSEYIARNEERGEITVMYARKNCTIVLKERNGETLEVATFSDGALQRFREMYLKEHPKTEREIYKFSEGKI